MDIFLLQNEIKQKLHPFTSSSSGWININCKICVHEGEPTPDKRKRGAFLFGRNGEVIYKCFRCHFSTGTGPSNGFRIGRKMEKLLTALGFNISDIGKIRFHYLPVANQTSYKKEVRTTEQDLTEVKLPTGAESFKHLIINDENDTNFLDAVAYIYDRYPLFDPDDFFWTPNKDVKNRRMNRRVIVPFRSSNGKTIVGWTARSIDNNETKYISNQPKDFIFNSDAMYNNNRKYIIVVEGVFDAIHIDGIAVLRIIYPARRQKL